MSLRNNDYYHDDDDDNDDDDDDKRQNAFFGRFDKQGVDFTFLSLLPMKWINKNKTR